REKDPIVRFRNYLIKQDLATEKELDKIEAEVAKRMEDAVDFSMNSPEPDPAHVLDDVFYEG
ncbi:MAG TPA: pyruvate dehydrogenase (acetyl-transferring) E1 component subunit alpha, partial [Clostridiaceae bacterium]|nr:pyruvate dehydrogenase (acetyl-transferring) E1 component subunit alpha [Clostridiaceae bacterium]